MLMTFVLSGGTGGIWSFLLTPARLGTGGFGDLVLEGVTVSVLGVDGARGEDGDMEEQFDRFEESEESG